MEILRGIDLDIADGETVAVLGPSGSGKSSLMAVLSGLERASGGALSVAGQDFAAMGEDALAHARRGRIGIILQAFHLLPTMTAAENVATPMELAGMAGAREKAAAELEAVGLGPPAHPLSAATIRRRAAARRHCSRHRARIRQILFADEPTGNLDSATGETIIDLLFAAPSRDGRDADRHHP